MTQRGILFGKTRPFPYATTGSIVMLTLIEKVQEKQLQKQQYLNKFIFT